MMTKLPGKAWFSSLTWWIQIVLVLFSYVIVASIGALFIAPTGAGSDRILYIILLVYSCFLILFGTRTARVLGIVLGMLSLIGVLYETKEKQDFHHRMEEKAHQHSNRQQSAIGRQSGGIIRNSQSPERHST